MFEGLSSYFDSRRIPDGEVVESDVCIVGAGAAGLTIAQQLAGQPLRVCLLESGGLWPDDAHDALNAFEETGHPVAGGRLRFFGGTTNHWGGHCVPIRAIAFEKRDWIPHSGWPFGRDHMDPFYSRAHAVLGIGDYDYDPEPVARRLGFPMLPFKPDAVETVLSRYNRLRFGDRFREALDRAENASAFVYATVTSINLDADRRAVTDVGVTTLAGNAFTVRAKFYVLATGGIENARLLLANNRHMPAGLGNLNDLVGRFFMDHIWYSSGYILPADQNDEAVALYAEESDYEDDYLVRCHLALPEERVRALRIPDYRVELQVMRSHRWSEAAASYRRLRRSIRSLSLDRLYAEDILNVLGDPAKTFAYATNSEDPPLVYGFANYVEPVPNPESRVMLSSEKDALGLNRADVRWKLTNQDKEGIKTAQHAIAQEVGRSGIGRMNIVVPESEEYLLYGASGGHHHMGTTRMDNNPRLGVVDADCRVHGLENLYVAGSSVFPAAGYPNPTLTIVALSLRLADHLESRMRKV